MLDSLLARASEFKDFVTELIKWMAEEGKSFTHTERLLYCGMGIYDSLKLANNRPDEAESFLVKALNLAEEFNSLFTNMASLGIITETQSTPLLSECLFLMQEIQLLITESADNQR